MREANSCRGKCQVAGNGGQPLAFETESQSCEELNATNSQ